MDTLWILVYSKFSNSSQTLLNFIEKSNINTPFQLLNIDNKEIRSKLLNDQRFKIKYVPCIIRIDSHGVAYQYEGEKAFNVVQKMYEEAQPQMQPQMQPQVVFKQSPVQAQPQMQQQVVFKQSPAPVQAQPQMAPQDELSTPIEDLLDISDEPAPASEPEPSKKTGKKVSVAEIMAGRH